MNDAPKPSMVSDRLEMMQARMLDKGFGKVLGPKLVELDEGFGEAADHGRTLHRIGVGEFREVGVPGLRVRPWPSPAHPDSRHTG